MRRPTSQKDLDAEDAELLEKDEQVMNGWTMQPTVS